MLERHWKYAWGAVFALAFLFNGPLHAADKIKIEKLDDLPRHTYTIQGSAVDFIHNDEAVAKLATKVKKDIENDLAKYDIQDKTTLKDFDADLGIIALLEGRYDDYLTLLKKRRDLEDKEALKLTTGLYTEAYIAATRDTVEDFDASLKAHLAALVDPLPYDIVGDQIKSAKGGSEILSAALIEGRIESAIQPVLDGSKGVMSKDIALSLLGAANTIRNYIPHKQVVTEVYGDYLDAHKVVKDDIWKDREFTLKADANDKPVVVAIWDSGVDTGIYGPMNLLWTNEKEIPDNGKDDDHNGYVDDVHGIAYDLHSQKTQGLLFPIGDVEKDRPKLERQMKGLEDITSGIDSPEASELKMTLSKLKKDEVKPFIEGISKYGNYCHGTHVTGIAVHGNPFARVLGARITFDYHMIPELPTVKLAKAEAKMDKQVIKYFKKHNVRVVNMSWGGDLASVEAALEANNAGGTPEERKELARKIFDISRDGLYKAIKSAPDILFITSAGNADNNVNFEEVIPSSFDLPNIMTVGAVDQAGDETSFTSFGKVDVYANGFEVLSYVPGGDEMKLSGTSMSSPNVTNLAAKLLAIKPNLTVAQLRKLIQDGCDDHMAGDRNVRLINPKKSLELLKQM